MIRSSARLLSAAALLAACAVPRTVFAEHRVALLIGQSRYEDARLALPARDLTALAAALEKSGVRCTQLRDLPGEKLKPAIETFVASVPTRGTALVVFAGRVLPGNFKGQDGTYLTGTDAKDGNAREVGGTGYELGRLCEALASKGGAAANVVVVDPHAAPPADDPDLPEGTLLAWADVSMLAARITGRGNLLAEIGAAAVWSKRTVPADATVAGRGTDVVSGPDAFAEGRRAGDEWVDSRGQVFCWCPPGSFVAGSPESEPGRYPDETRRTVEFPHGFWIAKHELTLREAPRRPGSRTLARRGNDPVSMIHLDDARNMTEKTLTDDQRRAGRLPDGWHYSLTTSDEWEYAARAGTSTRWSFGDDVRDLPRHANFGDRAFYETKDVFANSADRTLDDGAAGPAPVGSYAPNPWGLHDVHGNLAEWCLDGSVRGGGWISTPDGCRSAHRHSFGSRDEQEFLGYRLVIRRVPDAGPGRKTQTSRLGSLRNSVARTSTR